MLMIIVVQYLCVSLQYVCFTTALKKKKKDSVPENTTVVYFRIKIKAYHNKFFLSF